MWLGPHRLARFDQRARRPVQSIVARRAPRGIRRRPPGGTREPERRGRPGAAAVAIRGVDVRDGRIVGVADQHERMTAGAQWPMRDSPSHSQASISPSTRRLLNSASYWLGWLATPSAVIHSTS